MNLTSESEHKMPMKSIFYSEKADDPISMALVLQNAIDKAAEEGTTFNRLVNVALRQYLGMPEVSLTPEGGEIKGGASKLAELAASQVPPDKKAKK